jgi:hypothetical protein
MDVLEYTLKPAPVKAVRVTLENMEEVAKWCNGGAYPGNAAPFIEVPTMGTFRHAFVGDYVVHNEDSLGKFYPLSAETFERRYQRKE